MSQLDNNLVKQFIKKIKKQSCVLFLSIFNSIPLSARFRHSVYVLRLLELPRCNYSMPRAVSYFFLRNFSKPSSKNGINPLRLSLYIKCDELALISFIMKIEHLIVYVCVCKCIETSTYSFLSHCFFVDDADKDVL